MERVIGLARLFIWNCKLKLSRGMEFRADFIAGLIISVAWSSIGPLMTFLIFYRTNGYPGWDSRQIMLFQGILLLWGSIKDTLFGEVRGLIDDICRNGEFDRLLLKPYPPMGILLTSGFNLSGLGSFIAGTFLIVFSSKNLALTIGFSQVLMILLLLLSGIVLYMAFVVLYCTISIMFIYMGRLGEIMDKLLSFSQYPMEIFTKTLQVAFVTFLPLAIWVYFPTQVLLNRFNFSVLWACIPCMTLFMLSLVLWNHSLKKYTSAGG